MAKLVSGRLKIYLSTREYRVLEQEGLPTYKPEGVARVIACPERTMQHVWLRGSIKRDDDLVVRFKASVEDNAVVVAGISTELFGGLKPKKKGCYYLWQS